MKHIIIAFALILTLFSCKSTPKAKIYGVWTTIDLVDNTGMNVSDRIEFKKDGRYELTIYSNGDSVISQLKGTFKIEDENHLLIISTNKMNFVHKIIELDKDILILKTSQGVIMKSKKIK